MQKNKQLVLEELHNFHWSWILVSSSLRKDTTLVLLLKGWFSFGFWFNMCFMLAFITMRNYHTSVMIFWKEEDHKRVILSLWIKIIKRPKRKLIKISFHLSIIIFVLFLCCLLVSGLFFLKCKCKFEIFYIVWDIYYINYILLKFDVWCSMI